MIAKMDRAGVVVRAGSASDDERLNEACESALGALASAVTDPRTGKPYEIDAVTELFDACPQKDRTILLTPKAGSQEATEFFAAVLASREVDDMGNFSRRAR